MTSQPNRNIARRTALTVLGVTLVSACRASEEHPRGPTRQPSASPTPVATPAATTLPDVAPYEALPGEVEPHCKDAAAKAITAALTWQPGEPPRALADRLKNVEATPSLVTDLEGLVGDHLASTVKIVYPQYGGLGDRRTDASVMLVARQTWRTSPGAEALTRDLTVDVRLRRHGRRWLVESAAVPTLPAPAPKGDQTTRRLLENDAVALPAAARADVLAGIIDRRLAHLLNVLSRRWRIHVQVLKSGHPTNVYGTKRISNHTRGRAVDIWAIDDIPVVSHSKSVWSAVMREAASVGADEIGGPGDLDGRVGRRPYFTNDVHRDHIHIGFEDS